MAIFQILEDKQMKRNIIKETRKQKGLGLYITAKKLELPVWLYWYYENHLQYISYDMIKNIVRKIEV